MKVVYAPEELPAKDNPFVFLAGSIEMGKAEDWQSKMTAGLSGFNCTLLNPRRPDWDSSWKQEKDNPQFRQQVLWELNGLEKADVIAMYFVPGTMSPISLLELGLFARDRKVIVCCPEGFWRKGNVDIVAEKYGLTVCSTLDNLIFEVINQIS
jgi:hypothetical protein